MIKYSPNEGDTEPTDREDESVIRIPESVAKRLEAYAKAHDTTVEAVAHEMIAVMFREEGVPLPPSLIGYLDAHDRPIPPAVKRGDRKCNLH